MTTPGKLEAAFDADREADPLSWTYTDLTDLTEANMATITRGRSSSRSAVADPASASWPLRNGGGDTGVTIGSLTPRKATGDHYPGVRRGLPLRYSLHTGASTLAFTGESSSRIATPDHAGFDLDAFAVAVQFRAPIRYPRVAGFTHDIIGQWGSAGNRAWRLVFNHTAAVFQWSADGTATAGEGVTTLALPSPDAGPLTFALEFDNDNGASGNTSTWYLLKGTIAQLIADKGAYLFGDPDINSGTTTIFNSTASIELGDITGSGFLPLPGCVDAWYMRAGTLDSGTVVIDTRNLPTQPAGTTSFADQAATPKTWTVTSPAEITDRKIRLLGEYGANKGTYPGAAIDGTAQRTITAAGPLRRMRRHDKPLRSALYRRITAPVSDVTVYDYFPLEDGRDTTRPFAPIGGSRTGQVSLSYATDDTLPASQPLPAVSGGQPYGWNLPLSGTAPATGWEWTFVVNIPVAPDAGASESLSLGRIDMKGGTIASFALRIDDTFWQIAGRDHDDVIVLSSTANPVDDSMFGAPMIVALNVVQNGADIDWDVDLIPIGPGVVFGGGSTLASETLGSPSRLRALQSSAPQEGASFGHFTVTSGAVPGWLAPADTAYVGEPDTARVFRLCRELGTPAVVDGPFGATWAAAIAAGARAMGPQRALPLLTLLEECAVVGGGFLGEPRELLGILYRSGVTFLNQTPALTVTARQDGFESADDDRDYLNSVEAARPDGSSAVYTATGGTHPVIGTEYDHPDDAGLYETSKQVNLEDDADLIHHAAWLVHEATWPEERHDTVPIELAVDPTLIDTWHDRSVGDALEAENLPDAAEASSTVQLIDGWTETIRPASWDCRPNTRAAGPHQIGALDDGSLTVAGHRVPQGDSTLNEALTTTETDVDVAFTTSRWVTTAGEAGHFPFDIIVAGEVMTVTAITATTSPQTFTVTRSVNGVVKAHSSGEVVEVYQPLRVRI